MVILSEKGKSNGIGKKVIIKPLRCLRTIVPQHLNPTHDVILVWWWLIDLYLLVEKNTKTNLLWPWIHLCNECVELNLLGLLLNSISPYYSSSSFPRFPLISLFQYKSINHGIFYSVWWVVLYPLSPMQVEGSCHYTILGWEMPTLSQGKKVSHNSMLKQIHSLL